MSTTVQPRQGITIEGGYHVKKSDGTYVTAIDSDGNIDAPVTTTDLTTTGDTTLGNASTDTLTVPSTSLFSAPVTVGEDDTGYDVQFFGATSGKSLLWDESADKLILTGDATIDGDATVSTTGSIVMTAGSSIASSVSDVIATFMAVGVQQAVSTATAVTLTEYFSTVDTTSGALALTLADSTVIGQVKKVQMIVDNGDATLTFNTDATIVFADVGDTAELAWNGTAWVPVALYNIVDGATAPAYTPAS